MKLPVIIEQLRTLARDGRDLGTRRQACAALRALAPDELVTAGAQLPREQASALMAAMGANRQAPAPRPYVDRLGQLVMPCETPTQARARLARGGRTELVTATAQLPREQASMLMAAMGVRSTVAPRPHLDRMGQLVVPCETPTQARKRLGFAA